MTNISHNVHDVFLCYQGRLHPGQVGGATGAAGAAESHARGLQQPHGHVPRDRDHTRGTQGSRGAA